MNHLTEKQEKLLVLFRQAIGSEREAQELYAEMLHHCDDASIKHILEDLLVQEKLHEEQLIEKYNELRRTTEFEG
jgi:rubrerythrin